MHISMKKILVNLLKISFAVGLIFWLVKEGKIDLSQIKLFFNSPKLILANISYWIIIAVFVGALRWSSLLKGVGIGIKYINVCIYTLIGFFFNTAMPGAVGGDIIKAIYVVRSHGKNRKTPTLLSILLDRVVGMAGLFTIAFIGVTYNWHLLYDNPILRSLAVATVAIFSAVLVFFLLVFFPIGKKDLLGQVFSLNFPGFSILNKIYLSFIEYRKNPKSLILAWLLSVLIQGAAILYMWFIADLLGVSSKIEFGIFASITPLGILTTAIPLAPGGMGVGHVAFDKILGLAGVAGGANIFNIFFLGQMSLNLLGVIPYLLFKKPTQEELEEELQIESMA